MERPDVEVRGSSGHELDRRWHDSPGKHPLIPTQRSSGRAPAVAAQQVAVDQAAPEPRRLRDLFVFNPAAARILLLGLLLFGALTSQLAKPQDPTVPVPTAQHATAHHAAVQGGHPADAEWSSVRRR